MARPSASSRSWPIKRRRPTKRELTALLSRVADTTKRVVRKMTLADLIKRHRGLEALTIDLADAMDALSNAPRSAAGQRVKAQLRGAEARLGKRLGEIEDQAVKAHAIGMPVAPICSK